ncbi:hypothetical protein [Streptomyces filipinensis]|uniref:hypothetical protein n=1 Tax=Streptomyces filipinensis TaxID=66887 RepID=UPI00178616C3|nr:hypothetical protein [Streptomyces filipinensis]
MGVLRGNRRGVRILAVTGLVVGAGGAVVACQPTGLSSASAAYTTDTTATARLKQQRIDVDWLTCTGDYGRAEPARTPSPSESTVISVYCRGQTRDGRKITLTGKVTKAVDGACVRGDLTAKVGGRQVFHVDGLGDCDARPAPTYRPPTYRPGGGQPTVTVTVTRTLWCKGDPTCWPAQGK